MGGVSGAAHERTGWIEIAPVSGWARGSHALLLVGVLVMVGVGLYLTPDPAGHGTHQQLGLPPCTIYFLTERPCPSCGLTTSVSAILHGQFALAWRANPLGFLIVAIAIAVALNSLMALGWGRTLRIENTRFTFLLLGLLTLWLMHGAVRFWLHQ
ncbi:MAG: DUF2752 domain-containing protein [Fimbriimonadales bacterium]|nr:MAG: hypothetical protein KatS3mg018_0319 [Fimbriimonadales bacterium]